jgi:hypothetical protein
MVALGEAVMRVFALKENVRKFIFHPRTRARFNDAGEAVWPLDQFTVRRIRDGDVSLTPPTPPAEETTKPEYSD